MAYENRSANQIKQHSLSLEGRKILVVNGVERVESFDETEVIMLTSEGNLRLRGSGMFMAGLDRESGQARVEGLISDISYEEVAPSGSLWAKLFH